MAKSKKDCTHPAESVEAVEVKGKKVLKCKECGFVMPKFYARKKNLGFTVQVLENEKPIPRVDANGNVKRRSGGIPIYEVRNVKFDRLTGTPKHGYVSEYTPKDGQELRVCVGLADDPSTSVMTVDTFKQSANKEAYDMEQKVHVLAGAVTERDAEIAELKQQLAAAKAK